MAIEQGQPASAQAEEGPPSRRLIEEWLPIAALGEESVRERRSMTALPPIYYLHVWWARRPLVASRAAILASLLPSDVDRDRFLHILGIHGDPVASRRRIDRARRAGERFEGEAYTYDRAFKYQLSDLEREWLAFEVSRAGSSAPRLLDPTAGGGSIPFESMRMGFDTLANDLNPVAALILRATVQYAMEMDSSVLDQFGALAKRFIEAREERLAALFPTEPVPDAIPTNYLWARTVRCPYCDGLIPLSSSWKLGPDGTGVRLLPETNQGRTCRFEIVRALADHSPGTVSGGDARCPFPDCGRVVAGDEVKRQAQEGLLGEQLYTVIYKQRTWEKTKTGKSREKWVRKYRSPRPEDDRSQEIAERLAEMLPQYEALDLVPTEEYPEMFSDRMRMYGVRRWTDLFSPRQLLCHITSVEVFRGLLDEHSAKGNLPSPERAAFVYLALAIDKLLNYNSRLTHWHAVREVVAGTFDIHEYAMKWRYVELPPLVQGVGFDWAIDQTSKCVRELLSLAGKEPGGSKQTAFTFGNPVNKATLSISCSSADSLHGVADQSIDAVVMDPPLLRQCDVQRVFGLLLRLAKADGRLHLPGALSIAAHG